MTAPEVHARFDPATESVSYLVIDPGTRKAALIDPVLDYEPASGTISTAGADALLALAQEHGAEIAWLLDTHAHADHLTASHHLRGRLGVKLAIGFNIVAVQSTFAPRFGLAGFPCDGSQFDRLLAEGDTLAIGDLALRAMHTPGHTPACMTYLIGDAAFVGDTIFMPDYGTARTDFPGGDAATLYRSIRRILALPAATRIFVGHDYKAPGRDAYAWETTVAAERAGNRHVRDGVGEAEFVAMRTRRDATLTTPRLLLPSLQVNIRAGALPPPDADGTRRLAIPLTLPDGYDG